MFGLKYITVFFTHFMFYVCVFVLPTITTFCLTTSQCWLTQVFEYVGVMTCFFFLFVIACSFINTRQISVELREMIQEKMMKLN